MPSLTLIPGSSAPGTVTTDPYHPMNHKFLDMPQFFNASFDDYAMTGTGRGGGPGLASGPQLSPRLAIRLSVKKPDPKAENIEPSQEMLDL
jgi:hypothetical protein